MKVLIVGAGPAGSTAAYYLAKAGIDVTVLEKTSFPREKVCGDGLTPRAVREIQKLGLPHPEADGWRRNKGLRLIAGGRTIELPWPEVSDFPQYGLIRTRLGFDEELARHAAVRRRRRAGTAQRHRGAARRRRPRDRRPRRAAGRGRTQDGRDARLQRRRRARRGRKLHPHRRVAGHPEARRPARSASPCAPTSPRPRHDDDWMEGWLELPGRDGKLLPGYGWVFGVGDGTSNVGLGILNSSKEFGKLDYKQVLREWTAGMPAEWGFTPENQVGEIRGAALPMGFNRTPHYSPGLLLLGDAGGMVSPFNGEGISYAMESARFAAEFIIDAAARVRFGAAGQRPTPTPTSRGTRTTCGTSGARHFTLGRAFAAADRQARRHEARPADRHAHSCADALRGADAGQPHRSGGQGLRGQGHPASWNRWSRPRPTRHVQRASRTPAPTPRFPQQKLGLTRDQLCRPQLDARRTRPAELRTRPQHHRHRHRPAAAGRLRGHRGGRRTGPRHHHQPGPGGEEAPRSHRQLRSAG